MSWPMRTAIVMMIAAPFVAEAAEPAGVIDAGVGTSVIKNEGRSIARVLLSDPSVAEIRLLEEGQYQVRGVQVGNTDLYVWFRGDESRPRSYRVMVTNDLSDMERRIREAVKVG